MPGISKTLVQPFRRNLLLVGAGWRAYFAPYNIALGSAKADTLKGPTMLDLQQGPFDSNVPPAGFFDTGWIRDYKFTPESKIGQIRSGRHGAVRAQVKGQVGETFEFKFRESSRMAWKIAHGSIPMNLLAAAASTVGPISGSGALAVPLHASGYQVNGAGTTVGTPTLFVPAGSGAQFSVGDYVVCDVDYVPGTSGLVGSVGAPVATSTSVTDPDYIRRTSDFVARIIQINLVAVTGADGLMLSQALVGGGSGDPTGLTTPAVTSKVQKVRGFAAREGGAFISEWTGLFLCDMQDSAQIAVYYPHISAMQFRGLEPWAIENIGTAETTGYELDAAFQSLAFDDPLDGETVVCYRAFYPGGRKQDLGI